QPVRPGVEVARPGFLAPEQLEGQEPDSRADFFSLGAVAYHALTGHLPYPGATVGEVRQTLSTRALEAPTVHVAEIPPRLEAVLMKCLAVQPDQRYASIGDLLADLDLVEV
ncbi:MAG: protein kinase, partial [Acidobacteriota bacterium]